MAGPPPDAVQANQRGYELACSNRYAEAVPHYLEAVRIAPGWCDPWFNLGIAYKLTLDFHGSLRASERALVLDRESVGPGALWNLGIAATAIGDWVRARRAWKDFGLEIPEGEGPIDCFSVPTPIRTDPRGRPEVLWTVRIDPARARVRSVPLPASNRRFDDLLLHDGAINGYRKLGGKDVPVFDELTVLETSRYETWTAKVTAPEPEDVRELADLLEQQDIPFEDWTGSIQMLCERCSTGVPHEHHGDEAEPHWKRDREVALALAGADASRVLEDWAAAGPGRACQALARAL